MSWESYYQRASGSNVDRVLADMAESRRRREEEQRRVQQLRAQQQFEVEQGQRDAQARIVAAYMANPNAQTRAAAMQYGVRLPDYQPSPEEQFNQRFYGHVNENYDPTKPLVVDPVAAGFANVDLAGKQPWMETARQRYTYAQPETLPAPVVSAQRVEDKLDLSAEEIEKKRQYDRDYATIKLPESRVGVTKTRAETGKIGAETRKIGEETITERESRDPNSPTARAKGSAAGRRTFSEKMAASLDKEIDALRKDQSALEMKLIESGKTVDKTLATTRLDAIRKAIAAKTQQRDALMSGRGEAYVPPPQPRKGDTTAVGGKLLYFDGKGWTDPPK